MNQDAGSLTISLKALHLPTFASHLQETTAMADNQGWSHKQFLQYLAALELEEKRQETAKPQRASSKGLRTP